MVVYGVPMHMLANMMTVRVSDNMEHGVRSMNPLANMMTARVSHNMAHKV